jgi:hypothetical protein
MSWLLAHAWWALFALVAASWLAVPAFLLADGVCSALLTWRAGRADAFEPDAPHCEHCARLDSDAANGITPTDFTLWAIEMESTP